MTVASIQNLGSARLSSRFLRTYSSPGQSGGHHGSQAPSHIAMITRGVLTCTDCVTLVRAPSGTKRSFNTGQRSVTSPAVQIATVANDKFAEVASDTQTDRDHCWRHLEHKHSS